MNMNREVFLFTRHDGYLVKCHPTAQEVSMGRRMAATLQNAIADMHRAKQTRTSIETSIGRLEISVQSMGRAQELRIHTENGELNYKELRDFLVLACQYMTGEYPLLQVDFDGTNAVLSLPSRAAWWAAVGLV